MSQPWPTAAVALETFGNQPSLPTRFENTATTKVASSMPTAGPSAAPPKTACLGLMDHRQLGSPAVAAETQRKTGSISLTGGNQMFAKSSASAVALLDVPWLEFVMLSHT